jgi:hypothetical protein
MREKLLHGKKASADVDRKACIEKCLVARLNRGEWGGSGIQEQHINHPKMLHTLSNKTIEITQDRYVASNCVDFSIDLCGSRLQFGGVAPKQDKLRSFLRKQVRRRQADSAAAARNYCHFSN